MNMEPGTSRLVEKVSDLEMLPMDRYGEIMPGLKWNPLRFDETTRSGFFCGAVRARWHIDTA